jgi:undecaprenyl pyrophosphate phosphatase UppP
MFAGLAIASSAGFSRLLGIIPLVAWVALAVMTGRWVQGQQCHWLWPVLGTFCGVVSAATFIWVFYVYVSAVPLAIYLVWWHLYRGSREDGEA